MEAIATGNLDGELYPLLGSISFLALHWRQIRRWWRSIVDSANSSDDHRSVTVTSDSDNNDEMGCRTIAALKMIGW